MTERDARRLRGMSLTAAEDLGEVLGDAIDRIGRKAVVGFRSEARAFAALATGSDPVPAIDPADLFDQAIWDDAVLESENLLAVHATDTAGFAGIVGRIPQPFVDELVGPHLALIDAYGDEARARIGNVLRDGFAKGSSVDQVAAALVKGNMNPNNAMLVARTNMIGIGNGGALVGYKAVAEPGDQKTWLSTPDEKTRPDHVTADGQTVPLDQPFIVGGEYAQHPGDPTLSLAQAGNCRCSLFVVQAP